jgi:hypothetical protein
MPKKEKNGTKVMTFEEMQEVISYLVQQDAKHEARFARIEGLIEQNSTAQLEAEKRFNKQIKQVLRIHAETTKLLAENTEAIQTAQLRLMDRTEALEEKVNVLVDAINKLTLNRDRTGKNGNGHKRPSSKK